MTDQELLVEWYKAYREEDPVFWQHLDEPMEEFLRKYRFLESSRLIAIEQLLWQRAKQYVQGGGDAY